MSILLAHQLQWLRLENLWAHNVELQICRLYLGEYSRELVVLIFKVPLIMEKKASLVTISGQDLGLPKLERISSQ